MAMRTKSGQTQTGERPTDSAYDSPRALGQLGRAELSATIFASLKGGWKISRTIEDIGTFRGAADFELIEPATFSYREDGQLELISGLSRPAFREYYYQLAGDRILVSFADAFLGARPFLSLFPQVSLADSWARDVHSCGPDQYDCTYRFVSQDRFTTRINVEGKAKRYSLFTVYSRTIR